VKAIAKTRSAPGLELIEVPEPAVRPGHVKLKIKGASVCGTDLHIYQWDAWSASRIKPPRIVGHEFCGIITEVGEGVTERAVGQFVASESHIVPLDSLYLLSGRGHVAPETEILGVDTDGGFAEYAVIPWQNARITDPSVPVEIAAFQDALGNAVHTVYDAPGLDNPVAGQQVLITGMGPIGLFAVAICKALGAKKVVGTEVSPYRIELAKKLGVDRVVDVTREDVNAALSEEAPDGFDATLEMSGHPSSLELAIRHTQMGGRISLLGVFKENIQPVALNDLIFKGIRMQGIVGRKLWETWDQMSALLATGKLDLAPVVETRSYLDFEAAFEQMKSGQVGKITFLFPD
jgi:threonine 3-dehydrogenase